MKDQPTAIPSTTGMFQIDILGKTTRRRFLGEFDCKIPTLKDQSMIAKFEAHLNGDQPMYLESGVLKLHKYIAYLKYTITDAPKFWKESDNGFQLNDFNVVEEVYNKVIEFENEWIKQLWGTDEQPAEENN